MTDVGMDGEYIPEMVKESTVWDVYNNEARKVDNELVKDWRDSLNFLLVFAAIFAAVLTAFIIESKKMLEQDPTEILVDITIQYFNSMGNPSRVNLTRPDFEPGSAAISINCLLFASLGASLLAALASVVALQWVADYDAVITRGGSSPLDRAKRRQFRFAGITRWKMRELISALPLLLHSSVVLFFVGAIQWMWTLHHVVGYVAAGGTTITVLFYGSTTLLGAVYVSLPFRTPFSRGLYWLAVWILSLVGRFLLWLPIEGALQFCSRLYRIIAWHIRFLIFSDATLGDQSTEGLPSLPSLNSSSARLPLSASVPKWIKIHLVDIGTSRNREDETAKRDPAVEQEAVGWLAQQLPISDDAHERLLLCVSGILAVSTDNPPPALFHDSPWLAILELLSGRLLHQIVNQTPTEKNYQDVGILLRCISRPFIRNKVVPAEIYVRNPGDIDYWRQCLLKGDGVRYFGEIRGTPMAFFLARDVPVPSLGSKYELETAWNLTKWRNTLGPDDVPDGAVWVEVFRDIGRYSPEFLESCLCHFRTWTNAFWYAPRGISDYAAMFDVVVEQALRRDLTTGEALALVHAFAGYLTESAEDPLYETVDENNIIPQPLSYTLAVGSSESTRANHLAITLLVVRVAGSLVGTELQQWARWITLLLWISIPKESEYLEDLRDKYFRDKWTWTIWDEIESSLTGVTVEGPHVEEIGRILWCGDTDMMKSLCIAAFKDPHSLTCLELLLQWVPHCYTHHTGSQHILLHLYQGAQRNYWGTYARFNVEPIRLLSVDWTRARFNPIIAMLAMFDIQDLPCLRFSREVDLECASRILETVKAVKRQSVAFLRLLADITDAGDKGLPPRYLPPILEAVNQALDLPDEEYTTSLLPPLASRIAALGERLFAFHGDEEQDNSVVAAEAQRICGLLQTKYVARPISSTAQLRLLSCARSSGAPQPAVGYRRIHVPL